MKKDIKGKLKDLLKRNSWKFCSENYSNGSTSLQFLKDSSVISVIITDVADEELIDILEER